jgi:hypothetical protein
MSLSATQGNSLSVSDSEKTTRIYTDHYGNTRTMNTSNMGKWRVPSM